MKRLALFLASVGFCAGASRAETKTQWPEIVGPVTSAAQCRMLDVAYTQFQARLEMSHSTCLRVHAASAVPEVGAMCSVHECQADHDALYVQLEQRRLTAINACNHDARIAQQQCIGRFAQTQKTLLSSQSRDQASYSEHCFGPTKGDLAIACQSMKVRIAAADAAISRTFDDQRNECGN